MSDILVYALLCVLFLVPLGYAVYRARPAVQLERMARQLYSETLLYKSSSPIIGCEEPV